MIAGLFPGQGSQHVGMGKSFYDEFTPFRMTLEEASDALNLNLKKLCFDGPDAELTLTENAQPAILAVSVGCFRVAQEKLGTEIQIALGHSLGEYSALVAAGALPFADAIRWVRERGLAMQKAVPVGQGTMSAILGAEDAQVEAWCKEATAQAQKLRNSSKNNSGQEPSSGGPSERPADWPAEFKVECTVEPANYNSPGQIVVSGSVDAVDCLEKLVKSLGIRGVMAKRLTVSAPFHCSLMNPARKTMEDLFQKAKQEKKLNPLRIPYLPNRTARITAEAGVIFDLLAEQVDHAVLWKQSMETLLAHDSKKAYEFGPGKVLQGLAKRIVKTANKEFEVTPIYDLDSLKAAEGTLNS